MAETAALSRRVVVIGEREKESGICGILCNELVSKECGSGRE